MVNKEMYEAFLEAGVSADKSALAAMSITPDHSEIKQKLIELKKGMTFLKFAVLCILVIEIITTFSMAHAHL